MSNGTIDVEDLASQVKSSFVTFFSNLIWTNFLVVAPWLSLPIIAPLAQLVINRAVYIVATQGGLVAFVINTGILTSAQGKDYLDALEKLHREGLSDEEWLTYEQEANKAFANLVRFSS